MVCAKNLSAVAVVAAAALFGLPAEAQESRWRYSVVADAISGGSETRACIASGNTLRLSAPYPEQPLVLCITEHPRRGRRVVLRFEAGGQFSCMNMGVFMQIQGGCMLQSRFDDGRVSFLGATEGENFADNEIVLQGAGSLIRRIGRASQLAIETHPYNDELQTAIFDVRGLQWPPPENPPPQ